MKQLETAGRVWRRSIPVAIVSIGSLMPDQANAQEPAAVVAEPQEPAEAEGQEEASTGGDEATEAQAAEARAAESAVEAEGSAARSEQDEARSDELAETKAQLKELQVAVAALETRQEEAELQAALGSEDEIDVEQDLFQIYGFMDMGFQRTWAKEESFVSAEFNTNAGTFVVGNVDLYFDFNPHQDWRGLAEIRFTGGSHGLIESYGGITGEDFSRTDLQQYDPHSPVINGPMWAGAIVMERAWIEWHRFELLKLRVGSFFSPFGIWNVDHGSPTLIATALPQFIQQGFFPQRQTGIQALGSVFKDEHEYAYRAWFSNGRTETANVDFTDDKAFGARAMVKKVGGSLGYQLGASFHHGRVGDKIVNITGAPPVDDDLLFEIVETEAYHETILGADLSVDLGKTRLRVEGVAQLRLYEDGKRPSQSVLDPTSQAQAADSWRYSLFAILAHRFDWGGLEPYLSAELVQQNQELADGFFLFGPGMNIHFNPHAQLKLQGTVGRFFDWKHEYVGDKSLFNAQTALARLVLAF